MALPSIPQAPKLPAHLQKFGNLGMSINDTITGGIGQGGGHPSIGIKGAKFRIREGANEELVNSFSLDVIIVNANKYLSKVFYAGAYIAGEEGKAPDCFSDNGTGPSSQSGSPQSSNCAACPHNVWGSKITSAGTKIKACSDYKKVAVVLADDPNRDVYELRIPGASLKDLNAIMTKLIKSQVPIQAIIFRLSFDTKVDFPKVLFAPVGYISEEQAASVEAWVGSDEAKDAVGENDVVSQAPLQVASYAHQDPGHAHTVPVPVPQQVTDPMAFLNNGSVAAEPQKPVARGRGRPAKTVEPVGRPAPAASPQMDLDLPGVQAAAASTPINPKLTDKSLDDLLAGIL